MWNGYVERRAKNDSGRKRDGAPARLNQPAEVELKTPEEVAEWVAKTVVMVSKDADQWAQAQNGLIVRPQNVYAGTARKGSSVYATVQINRTEVADICAEAVP
jgi:hypothetical protein